MASKRKKRYLRALGIPGVRGSQPVEAPVPAPEPAPPVVVPEPELFQNQNPSQL